MLLDSLCTEAIALATTIDYDKGIWDALNNRYTIKTRLGVGAELKQAAVQQYEFAKRSGSKAYEVDALINKGIAHLYNNENDSTLSILMQAEAIARHLPEKELLGNCEIQIGNLYAINLPNYPLAMEWYLKSLHSFESTNNLVGMMTAWQSIGELHMSMGNHVKALEFMQKAIEASKKLGRQTMTLQNSIGEIYRYTGKFPEAIAAYTEALKLTNVPYNIALVQSNLADVYLRMGKLSEATNMAFTSLKTTIELQDDVGISWLASTLARIHLEKNQLDSAEYYARWGLNKGYESNYLEFIRDNASALSNVYTQKKDYKKALEYYRVYIANRDSMVNSQVTNKANLLQHEYEIAKTETKMAELAAQKKNQKTILITSLSLLGLIIIITILLLRNNIQKRKANNLLQQSYNNVQLLEEIGQKISSSLSIEKIIGTVYKNVNELMDANVFGIGIYNDELKQITFPSTYEQGELLPLYHNDLNDTNRLGVVCYTTGKEIILSNIEKEYSAYVQSVPTPHAGGQPVSVIYLPLESKGKKLGVLTVQSFKENAYTDYHLYMLRNIGIYTAIALDNASSYEALKSAQQQLIHAEKMASLGELTAGIAHEIQNPLNFVNNFSEINKELIDELQAALKAGNQDEANHLSSEIKANEEKITFHGKRAENIVRGMLQHSRSSSAQKEPTDINMLCDEYVRLAYHGLRAKDKSFNATIKTDFDESIGKLSIIPQEIGRVVLNLLTNAFYAAREKQKLGLSHFVPTVSITTSRQQLASGQAGVIISVQDNGMGIPEKIRSKIFQPFFTTKPTGQGTGLGLSMSYDIITQTHGGEIKVESTEGEGTTFTIILPIN